MLSSVRVWGLRVQPSTTRPTALSSRCGGRERRMPSRGEKGRGEQSVAEMNGCYMTSVLVESVFIPHHDEIFRTFLCYLTSFIPPSRRLSSYFFLSLLPSLPQFILLFLHLLSSLCHLLHPISTSCSWYHWLVESRVSLFSSATAVRPVGRLGHTQQKETHTHTCMLTWAHNTCATFHELGKWAEHLGGWFLQRPVICRSGGLLGCSSTNWRLNRGFHSHS